jgi:hypothetical protein
MRIFYYITPSPLDVVPRASGLYSSDRDASKRGHSHLILLAIRPTQ